MAAITQSTSPAPSTKQLSQLHRGLGSGRTYSLLTCRDLIFDAVVYGSTQHLLLQEVFG
jgi:hypothetical protein